MPEVSHDNFKVVNKNIINEDIIVDRYASLTGIRLPPGEIPEEDIKLLYSRDEVTHRSISKEIEDCFGNPPTIVCDNETLKKELEKLLFAPIHLFKKLRDGSLGAYLDGTALIYVNYNDGGDISKEPKTIRSINQCGVIYKKDISNYDLNTDITSKDFNSVTSWIINIAGNKVVHSSRVMHIIFDTIYGDPWGLSKLSPEYDSHVYRKIVVDSATSAFNQNAQGIRAFILPKDASSKELDLLEKEIKNLRVRSDMMIPFGTDIKHPSPNLADPKHLIEHLMHTCSSMPYTILTGTQMGAVTGSETNIRTYYMEIDKKRNGVINDLIMDKLLYIQSKGGLPAGDFSLDWGVLYTPDPETETKMFMQLSAALSKLVEKQIISIEEARNHLGSECLIKIDQSDSHNP